MKLVFATHNLHKFEEVRTMMPLGIELLNLNDIGCFEDIPETSTGKVQKFIVRERVKN